MKRYKFLKWEIGCFLLGFTLTSIFGLFNGVLLSIAIILIK